LSVEFVCAVATRWQAARGPGLDPDTDVGPADQPRDSAIGSQDSSIGAARGWRPFALAARGRRTGPRLLLRSRPSWLMCCRSASCTEQEILRTVCRFASFYDTDEAIALVEWGRATASGLRWTNDMSTAIRAAERLECGCGVNRRTPQAVEGPFRRLNESGLGRERGAGYEGLEEYMETKTHCL